MPTDEEIAHNFRASFPVIDNDAIHPDQPVRGFAMIIDEIKVTPCLRYDARKNTMIGACRDHSDNLVLEFASMVQADALKDALDRGQVHLATEVRG